MSEDEPAEREGQISQRSGTFRFPLLWRRVERERLGQRVGGHSAALGQQSRFLFLRLRLGRREL